MRARSCSPWRSARRRSSSGDAVLRISPAASNVSSIARASPSGGASSRASADISGIATGTGARKNRRAPSATRARAATGRSSSAPSTTVFSADASAASISGAASDGSVSPARKSRASSATAAMRRRASATSPANGRARHNARTAADSAAAARRAVTSSQSSARASVVRSAVTREFYQDWGGPPASDSDAVPAGILADGQRLLYVPDQLVHLDRLDQARDGSIRLGRRAQIPRLQACRQDDRDIAMDAPDPLQQINTGHPRHSYIGHHDVRPAARHLRQRRKTIGRVVHIEPCLRKDRREHLACILFIVDHEDPSLGRHVASPLQPFPSRSYGPALLWPCPDIEQEWNQATPGRPLA